MPVKTERCAALPKTVRDLAAALCADYARREAILQTRETGTRVRMEYEYLNRRIFDAARALCENAEEALLYIEEIGSRTGYAKSRTTYSETTYKERKHRVLLSIIRSLHLWESTPENGLF